jgi:hypothetical protein
LIPLPPKKVESNAEISSERAADISSHFINPPELIPLPPKKVESNAEISSERAADISRHFINPPELIPLPPKVAATCNIHKDVSSLAKFGVENEGASEVHVVEKLYGRIQSTDALKNSPFSYRSNLQGTDACELPGISVRHAHPCCGNNEHVFQ